MSCDNLGFTSSTDAVSTGNQSEQRKSHEKGASKSNGQNDGTNGVYSVELRDKKYASEVGVYDPYKQREVEHPTTNLETLLHLLKGSLGTGILAMPKAFDNAGYIVGLVGTFVIGFICTYCIHILVRSEYELCRRRRVPSLNYPSTAEAALSEGPTCFRRFARTSVHVINVFLLIYQLGACGVYVVFIATNLKSAIGTSIIDIDVRLYMLMLLLPLILINWVRNLKFLAPFTTIANGITFVSFGIILFYVFRDPISIDDRAPVGQVQNFPLFFGTVLFALEAIGVILPLENEMKTPRSFTSPFGVLNTAMVAIVLLYAGMGFFGYLRFGSTVQGSITLNLPDEPLAKAVQILLAIAIYVSHSLQCYVAVDISWNDYLGPKLEKNPRKLLWEYVTRSCLVVVTFLFAVAIPELELFISLFGALCLSALGIAFPAIIQTCAFWTVTGRSEKTWMIAKNATLVIFGLLGLIVGTYTSLRDIVASFG